MKFSAKGKVGILGGGQLARMMVLDAAPLGIETHVLSENQNDPAAQVCTHWHKGSPHRPSDLKKFLKLVPRATFESEFIDATLLKEVSKSTGCKVNPKPQLMAKIQDRWTQKKLLEKHSIPTSPFLKVDTLSDAEKAFHQMGPMVLKTRRNGYDGYGTHIIKNLNHLKKLEDRISEIKSGWIAEKFIPFDREVALMVSRDLHGQVQLFPFVETFQEDARCLWVKGPLNIKATKMKQTLSNFLNNTGYVGVMGIEFFQQGSKLIVNELAPRVHNSGHYTQDACRESQFALHLKCVLGWKTDTPETLSTGFAMMNLLGKPHKSPKWTSDLQGCSLHWYGKHTSRKGRKMGHLNCLSPSPNQALKRLIQLRRSFFI